MSKYERTVFYGKKHMGNVKVSEKSRSKVRATCLKFMVICQHQKYLVISKIEKVPRGIRGEKSRKDIASSRNLVSTTGSHASPKMGVRNKVSGRASAPCWRATSVANAPRKPLLIR